MKMSPSRLIFLASLLLLLSPAFAPNANAGEYVTTQGGRFLDTEGRQVLLRGLNIVDKSADWSQYTWLNEAGYADMQAWGLNCVRLGFTWASLEPEPGKYSEKCLAKLDERIAWAKAHGLQVFLDMHQDLFSMKFSDGAPEWATLTDGMPHLSEGSVWSDAYLSSSAVQRAFDNFWANTPGPDGVGIQERYALAWRHLAVRYAKDTTVIGYDLMNEPFIGSPILLTQMAMVQKFAERLAEKDGANAPSLQEIIAQWEDAEGRSKLMARLQDMDIYVPAVDAAHVLFADFEKNVLTAMFQRVTNAIREVDPNHIIFLETSISANMGVYSGIESVIGKDGNRDPQQAYAPHGYDIVVDSPDLAKSCDARVELIFNRHGETAKRLGMPMIVGEWGAFAPMFKGLLPAGRFLVRQFEKQLCGDFFWCHASDLARAEFFEIIERPYPQAVAGTLIEYHAAPETRAFTCAWKEDPAIAAPTILFLPKAYAAQKESIAVSPPGNGFEFRPAAEGSENVLVLIPPAGAATERRFTIGK